MWKRPTKEFALFIRRSLVRAMRHVSMIYKGNAYGVTKSWHAKVDAREINHETHDGALIGLLSLLKKELADKTKSAESEAERLRVALNQLGN